MNLDKLLIDIYEESNLLQVKRQDSEAVFVSEQIAVQALNVLGLVYCGKIARFDKAIECFKDAVKIDPGNWILWSNICHAYSSLEQPKEALVAINRAIDLSGGTSFDPFYNAGVIYTSQNCFDQAIEMYRKAMQLNPDHAQTNYNLGLLLLRTGQLKEGWEKYENRFRTNELTGNFKKRFIQDHWDGRKYKKKTLTVYSEQGLGDFIFYARFLPKVKSLGGKLICEAQEPLTPILGKNLKIDELVSRSNTNNWPKAPESDYCISICSLPNVLKIDSLDKIPTDPYIFAPKRPRPKEFSNKFNIGICWCGNSDHRRDHTRSFKLGTFLPLANHSNVQLFGLMKGVAETRIWPNGYVNLNEGIETFPMTSLSDQINDFGDVAHFINHLDLLITVDTGLAHLAGAMGKTAWVLLGKEVDWRWRDDTTVSEWYPSLRLFRYKDSWEDLIVEVVSQLPS